MGTLGGCSPSAGWEGGMEPELAASTGEAGVPITRHTGGLLSPSVCYGKAKK